MKRLLEFVLNKSCASLTALLCLLSYSNTVCSQTYTLSVGESVDVSQTAYNGGYIDNVGLATFIDPHLSFAQNYDGSAKITVISYFDYTATVKLVFIERYQSYYSGRYHTRAATYYKDINIKCKYVAPQPNVKPTKVFLPERVRVPLEQRVNIYPTYEPYGAKGTEFSWNQSQGTAVFSHGQYEDGGYHVTGRSPGLGSVRVKVDNDNNLYASTVIEVVDPNYLPPDNIFLPSSIEISVGGHSTLEPILVPEGTSTSYTWTSDNSKIATVNYGKVTGVKVGTTTVTVKTANNLQTTCTVNVVNTNGKDDEDDNGAQTTGSIDGHDFVDLGLSVKWATCNIGASKSEDFGSYFAWGETSTKSSYSWDNYKYGSNALNCKNIGSDISGTSYDAAYVNWGTNWRMPNEMEMGELISKCTITNTTQNGVDGFLVTGPNGNSIFLPTAGSKFTTPSSGCRYWTSTVDDYNGRSLLITYSNGKVASTLQSRARAMGLPVRAITSASSPTQAQQTKLMLSANPSGGSVESNTKVYLKASADGSTVSGADIYYTTNGSTPSKSSTKYSTSGITITQDCTLKAIAYKDGYETSDVGSWSYTIKSSTVEPTSISVSPSSKTIKVGETFTPTYSLTPSNATTTVTWTSDNSSIASVNSSTGLVTGKKAGSTWINAETANGKRDWCKVTVENNSSTVEPTSISVSPISKTIKVGETFTPTYSLTPSNATTTVTWSSDNSSIASVNSSTGLVTGKKAGYTYINATTANGKVDWCKVTVESNSSTVEPTSISVSPSSKTIKVGETFTPTYSLTPSNATTTVTWSSDNSSIASVNSSTGLVTGKKAGYTYINATTANGKVDWCKVTVTEDSPVDNGEIAYLNIVSTDGTIIYDKNLTVEKGYKVLLSASDKEYSSIPNCTYYYTLDGTTPTRNSSHYTDNGYTSKSNIIINNSCTLKVFAACDGYTDSQTETWNFTLKVTQESTNVRTSSAGYATFYDSQLAYTLPGGLSAQVVTNATGNKLTYKTIADGSVSGVVPAGTAVMLVSDSKSSGTYTLTSTENVTSYSGANLLHGSDEATTTSGSGYHYKLSYGKSGSNMSNVFGWYWGAANGGSFQIEGHKAWLVIPQASYAPTRGYGIDGEVLDIIDTNVDDDNSEAVYYDLQGRRISKPTSKGVYIKNGKKITIK